MEIDHIFIFSKNKGKETDNLVDFGFKEGSSRVHDGQGTRNRKIYFDNFFLEILWVIDQKEIQSKVTSVTKLWERSQFYKNDYSPYGLCFVNSDSTDKLFEDKEVYQPNYFPKGMSIEIITNQQNLKLPWTFRLPYRGEKKVPNEPIIHSNGIKSLTRTEFEIQGGSSENSFISYFNGLKNIAFKQSNRNHLTLNLIT